MSEQRAEVIENALREMAGALSAIRIALSPSMVPAVIDAEHLDKQRRWSGKTFGPGFRTKGVISHIKKELIEIENAPTDLSEWIDVVILAFDGAWRSGASSQEIIDALVKKQKENEKRTWPDWKTRSEDEPIEHIRETNAEIVKEK